MIPLLDFLEKFASKPKILLLAGCLSVFAVWVQGRYFLFASDQIIDSYSYYFAARALNQGQNPYDGELIERMGKEEDLKPYPRVGKQEEVYPYIYPPPLAGAWRIFTLLPPLKAHRAVVLLDALLLGLAIYLIGKTVIPARHPHALLLLFILFQAVNGAAVTSTRLGQVNTLLVVLIVAATYWHSQKNDILSTLFLALAILVKITPGVILLYIVLFYPNRWRYVGWTAVWMVMVSAASLLVAPPQDWAYFFKSLMSGPPEQSPYSIWGWLTIHGLTSIFIYYNQVWLYLITAVPLLALSLFSIKNTAPEERPLFAISQLIALSLLVSPVTWHHHFMFYMLPGFYFFSYHWGKGHRLMALVYGLLIIVVLLRVPGTLLMLRPVGTLIAIILGFRIFVRAESQSQPKAA